MASAPKSTWEFPTPTEASKIAPGTILFLPNPHEIPGGAYRNSKLEAGAHNHPVVILSLDPSSSTIEGEPWTIHSRARVAIIRSFHNTSLEEHMTNTTSRLLPFGENAEDYYGFCRVAPATKPLAKDTLHLRNKKGVKREWSYIDIRSVHVIELGALAFYGEKKFGVDGYRLTDASLKILEGKIGSWEEKKWVIVGGDVEEEPVAAGKKENAVEKKINQWKEKMKRRLEGKTLAVLGSKRKRGDMDDTEEGSTLDESDNVNISRKRRRVTRSTAHAIEEEEAERMKAIEMATAKTKAKTIANPIPTIEPTPQVSTPRKRVILLPKPMFGAGANSMKKLIGL